jgi:hypothetical protein
MKMPNKNTQKNAVDAPTNVLYVVLHGLVSLVEIPRTRFRAYLFDMGSEHRCLCGDFFAEEEIDYGSAPFLELKGNFLPGNATLDVDLNAVLALTKAPDFDAGQVVSTIDLPTPSEIIPFIVGDLSRGDLIDDQNELKKMPTHLSGIRIFKYFLADVNDFRDVRLASGLRDNIWICPPPNKLPVTNMNVAALHIYNEPPDTLSPAKAARHNKDEFNRSVNLFGRKVQMVNPASVMPFPRCESPTPRGLTGLDITPLDLREGFAIDLMNVLRSFWLLETQVGKGAKRSKLSKEALEQRNNELKSALPLPLINQLVCILGGAGGTQVCGGVNGTLG